MPFQNLSSKNNAISILSNGISDVSVTLIVKSGEGALFPSTFPYLLVLEKIVAEVVTQRELVKVVYRYGDDFTITRSAGYCLASDAATVQTNTAFAFSNGDRVSLRTYAEVIDEMNAELARLGAIALVDSSSSQLGGSMMSVAPASSTDPISLSEIDTRLPTQGENDAMAGTSGTVGSSNKFVTVTDPSILNNVDLTNGQTVAGVKTFSSIPVLPASDPTTANELCRKSYIDALI